MDGGSIMLAINYTTNWHEVYLQAFCGKHCIWRSVGDLHRAAIAVDALLDAYISFSLVMHLI